MVMSSRPASPEKESLAPGSEFAGYRVLRTLGAGAFGEVYEAVKGGRLVALKVLHGDVEGNDEVVARFVREARAVALLRHPSIVSAVEVGEHEGRPFLAMELLSGETLSALMKREKRLALGPALDILIPLMAAVRTVHAHGIVHRDLKPDNVFITTTAEGVVRPKVLDFGVAKMSEPGLKLTSKDTSIGTPNFMSPEQMLSPLTVDPRSDQWALGVLLYYMLTGAKPFAASGLADTLANVLRREPTPLLALAPEVPEAVARSVARALQKPPDKRFASVHDFAQTLLRYTSDATALVYATEFYAVSVEDVHARAAPPRAPDAARRASKARRAPVASRPPTTPRPPTSSAPAPTTREIARNAPLEAAPEVPAARRVPAAARAAVSAAVTALTRCFRRLFGDAPRRMR